VAVEIWRKAVEALVLMFWGPLLAAHQLFVRQPMQHAQFEPHGENYFIKIIMQGNKGCRVLRSQKFQVSAGR